MHEVCELVIKPIIAHHGERCSWSAFVNGGRARPPDLFISHSWSQPFRDFVTTLKILAKERGLTAGDVIWICTFANNQFDLDLGKDLIRSPFFAALRNEQCGTMALFLDRSATSLSRSWCNFELAVVTDTERNRTYWQQLQRTTDGPSFEPPVLEQMPSSSNQSDKALMLCTAAGLVGTRRVTSGPVLDALRRLDCRDANSSDPADRRSILNYIVNRYLEEPAPDEARLVSGLRRLHIEEEEEDEEKVSDRLAAHGNTPSLARYVGRRLGQVVAQLQRGSAAARDVSAPRAAANISRERGRLRLSDEPSDATYEADLIEANGLKLDLFNEIMRAECENALRLRHLVSGGALSGVVQQSAQHGAPSTAEGGAPPQIAYEHSGLRLHELRELEARLRSELGRGQPQDGRVAYEGTPLSWRKEDGCVCANGYHLWPPASGGDERGLMETVFGLAPGVTYVERLAQATAHTGGRRDGEGVQLEYYVICPWQARLHEVFSAIEWHAEAHDAPDRTTYLVHMLAVGDRNRTKGAVKSVEKTISVVAEGVMLVLDHEVSKKWATDSVSLWSIFELWVAEKLRLPLTLACSSGALATTRPFPGGLWEVGEFDVDVAWNMAKTRVSLDRLQVTHGSDADLLLSTIAGSSGESDMDRRRAGFVRTLNMRLPIRALPSVLRGAAFLDHGSDSAFLSDAIRLFEDLRRQAHVNLGTLRGPYGETPLHVIASRRRLNTPAEPGVADARREMQSLIRIGFDVNAQDDEGETPLHWAVFAGAEWCACLLLREGANPEVRSFRGETVLDLVRSAPTAFLGRQPSEHLRKVVEAAAAVSASVLDQGSQR
ncbi:hypothetical protein T492DRAFT_947751 [Pavlovales sp. CCMP2436]|nr:hypothetical protein T492DRAFT_947751 [Pavlovales sp. CCMP2436]